jgi:hypothetical protein
MANLGSIEARAIKHICLVGNRDAMVQGMMDTLILSCGRLAASRRMRCVLTWFETRQRVRAKRGPMINSDALLTMRTDRTEGIT